MFTQIKNHFVSETSDRQPSRRTSVKLQGKRTSNPLIHRELHC